MKDLYRKYFLILVLVLGNIFIWLTYFTHKQDDILKIDFLDIGQGDAIFIEAPNGVQLLIDGGRGMSVINELGKVMGFFDKSIDVVLATHPDADHVGGLPGILERYKIANFIDSVADAETSVYSELENRAKEQKIKTYYGMRGMVIVLDKVHGVYLHILYPNPDDFKFTDTNDLSIVAKLIYGDTSVMLTGDAPKIVEQMLVSTDKNYLESSILKAGHHGSKTSSSPAFVKAVGAPYAIISAGKDNSYGHPHAETMKTLAASGAEILETSKEGTIRFESNGVDVWLK